MRRMSERRTPRQIAREETLRRIKTLALEQLASTGASELSLRAIARELGIVSSAVYRYFASRDELITALIVDAYTDLAATLEASADGERGRTPWVAVCTGLRAWAVAQPHRFALVYGSAIPGYRAPQATIAPAGRVVAAFAATALTAAAPAGSFSPTLHDQLANTADELGELDEALTAWVVGAFARVVGALTLELNGHFVGAFEPADDLFLSLVENEADRLEW